jgi:dihydrofolate reductase
MDVAIYVAIAENGVIGRDGGLPWRLSTDLKRFKADTMGKPVIMGRKTYEGIGRPLPGRLNIVVTRDMAWRAEGVETANSLEAAIQLATVRGRCMSGVDEICVIGGGEIYAQALPLADRLHVTHVLAKVDGDAHFPDIDPGSWQIVRSEDFPAGEKDSHATRYTVYERSRPMTQVSS